MVEVAVLAWTPQNTTLQTTISNSDLLKTPQVIHQMINWTSVIKFPSSPSNNSCSHCRAPHRHRSNLMRVLQITTAPENPQTYPKYVQETARSVTKKYSNPMISCHRGLKARVHYFRSRVVGYRDSNNTIFWIVKPCWGRTNNSSKTHLNSKTIMLKLAQLEAAWAPPQAYPSPSPSSPAPSTRPRQN